jgi:cell wall-associated NlpC family hydrolase
VTDVERLWRFSTPRPNRGLRHSRWALPILVVVAVCLSTVTLLSRPSGALTLKQARAQAAQLLRETQTADRRVGLLEQRYIRAESKLHTLRSVIANTQRIVAAQSRKVSTDQTQLQSAALASFVNNGSGASSNPLFNSNQNAAQAAKIYYRLAEGNLSASVAALKNSSLVLTQQRALLTTQMAAAASATRTANSSLRQAQGVQNQLHRDLSHASSQISSILSSIRAAAVHRAYLKWLKAHRGHHPTHGGNSGGGNGGGVYRIPPTSPRALVAVRVALSFVGVPYVWGGASRSGVDCSGLVLLAWAAAGVSLSHYSGAQFNETIRIPFSAIKPGDILFYGYHGDEHESMYIGGGNMIEAPYTGSYVHVTPVRLDYGFAGVGRVR